MTDFILDPRLRRDCVNLGTLYGLHLLLMNNHRVPWFILVPETRATEFYELEPSLKASLSKGVEALSRLLKESFYAEKLNIATIGNIVSQMHIHVVGRFSADFCWPHPVWGASGGVPYEAPELRQVMTTLKSALPDLLIDTPEAP